MVHPNSLYDQAALEVTRRIRFNADLIEVLGLADVLEEAIFKIIQCHLVDDTDLLVQLNFKNSQKRKRDFLREEIRRKFAKQILGGRIPLVSVVSL